MPTREKSRRLGDLTYQEIRECARQDWLVVIPLGCTEQQGPHLPVDFDTWFAESLMLAAAEKGARGPSTGLACHTLWSHSRAPPLWQWLY